MAVDSVAAFLLAVVASAGSAVAGVILCRGPFTRSRRLLDAGARTTANIVEVVPSRTAGQRFPTDGARIVVEYEAAGGPRREAILLTRTAEDEYQVGDRIEVLTAEGRAPRARTLDEPNVYYGTTGQVVGAILLIAAALPYCLMFSAHALTP